MFIKNNLYKRKESHQTFVNVFISFVFLVMCLVLIEQGRNFVTRWIKARHFQIIDDYNYEGLEYYKNGQYNDAIDSFTKAIAEIEEYQFDKVSDYYSNRAQAYSYLGEYEKALEDYIAAMNIKEDKGISNAVLSIKQQIVDEYKLKAIDAYDQGDYKGAISYYSEAIMYSEKFGLKSAGNYYFERAQVYFSEGNYELALEDYTEALNRGEKDEIIRAIEVAKQSIINDYEEKGRRAYVEGNYAQAIEFYSKEIMYIKEYGMGDIGNCYFNRAQAYFLVENYSQALADYLSALDIHESESLLYAISVTYERLGITAKAEEYKKMAENYYD